MYNELQLEQLADQAKQMSVMAHDVVADSRLLKVVKRPEEDRFWLTSMTHQHPLAAVMNDVAHDQVAQRYGVPIRYYEKCRLADIDNSTNIAAENMNYWLHREHKDLMVRMLNPERVPGSMHGIEVPTCRAILSNRYLRLDNHEVLNAFLNGIGQANGLGRIGVLGGALTEKRMYVNVLFEGTEFDLAGPGENPDPHFLGVCMKNSEVGYGAAAVYAFLYRSYCTNGLVFGKRDLMGFERRHVGEVRGHGELSPETHRAIANVLISAAADVGRSLSDHETRERLIEPLRRAKQSARIEHAEPAFEVLAREIGLTETERSQAMEHFIREQDYTKFGAAQAVTWLGNDPDRGAERVQQLTEIGGDVITLPESAWKRVVEAA